LQVQLASKNLHSSQKMGLGGAGAVRAYDSGAGSGDQGWLLKAEWSKAFRVARVGADGQVRLFADAGGIEVNRSPWSGAGSGNDVQHAGLGWGVTLARGGWTLDLQNAYPVGPPDPLKGTRGRIWL